MINLKLAATLLGCATIVFCGGVASTVNFYSEQDEAIKQSVADIRLAAYQRGLKEGLEKGQDIADWKAKALSDHKYTSKICKAWWFDSSSVERNVLGK